MDTTSELVIDDIISCTPIESTPETSLKSSHKKTVFNKNNIGNVVFHPGEISRPKNPKTINPITLDSNQKEMYFLRLICEVKLLKNEKFRYDSIRTVGRYSIFKGLDHLKDCTTGHRIELDFSQTFYTKKPELYSTIMILGTVKYKTFIKDIEKIYVPFIVVKTWEDWYGKIDFHDFYYNARKYRSPQVDVTIPIEEPETASDNDMSDLDDEDFETTAFFIKLKNDGLLDDSDKLNECINSTTEKLFDDSDIIS